VFLARSWSGRLSGKQWMGRERTTASHLSRMRGEARIRKAIRKWQIIEWMEAAAGIDASEPGRRLEMRDSQHILHCRDPWCRVCREGGAWRFT